MKNLWLARLACLDLQKPTCDIASHILWSKNDDRLLHQLMRYIDTTRHYKLKGWIEDIAELLKLLLFIDGDLAFAIDNSRSTYGGWLVLA